jgi:Flp pilus assembly protein TadD
VAVAVGRQDLGDQKRAVELTALAVALKPDLSPAHNNHGRALENDDRLEDALLAYRRALR